MTDRTPRKTTAKKAAAKKAPARKYPAKNPTRPKGKPGPLPAVVRGFDRRMLRTEHQNQQVPPDPWTEFAVARRVLIALRAQATWELAAAFAKIDDSRLYDWNARGQAAMVGHDDLATLEATGVDDETLAMAAFHVLSEQARVLTGVTALDTISRAAQSDWRAAQAALRMNPVTRQTYSEVTKLEHSGPDGGAIPVEERAAALVARIRSRPMPAPGPDADGDGAGDG